MRQCPWQLTPTARGTWIALAGVLIDTPDALLVRMMGEITSEHWIIIFYKYLFTGSLTMLAALYFTRGMGAMWRSIRAGPLHVLSAATCQAAISVFLTLAFLEAEAASVFLCFSLSPLWAALFSRIVLREKIQKWTALALLLAAISIGLVFMPSFFEDEEIDMSDPRRASLHGDLYALAAGGSLGVLLTVNRSAALHAPQAGMIFASAFGSYICVVVAGLLLAFNGRWTSANAVVGGADHGGFIALAFADGACCAGIFVLFVIAVRYVSGAEVGLVSLLEIILGPFLVWMHFGEVPPKWTFLGGETEEAEQKKRSAPPWHAHSHTHTRLAHTRPEHPPEHTPNTPLTYVPNTHTHT